MENNTTVESWINDLQKEVDSSLVFKLDSENYLKIMEEDIIKLSSNLINGKKYKFANVKEDSTILLFKKDHSDEAFVFTDKKETEMKQMLDQIISQGNLNKKQTSSINTYLSCGLLRYSLDPLGSSFITAPLVFIPVIISKEGNNYFIQGIKDEFILNRPLIEKIYSSKKLSIDYPVKTNFSVGEYLYFISVKVKALNWSVIYEHLVLNVDLFNYYSLEIIKNKKNEISNHNLINRISYLNSEFLPTYYHTTNPLDSKFLAFLNANNDELMLLKKIANREPIYIRSKNDTDRNHLIINTILAYILNNKKILIAYDDELSHTSLLKSLNDSYIDKYYVDLGISVSDKKKLLSDIFAYSNYKVSLSLNENEKINSTVEDYYKKKNAIKLMINGLRKNDNPLSLSINKAIENYYKLVEYNDLKTPISKANRFSMETLNEQMNAVSLLSKATINLGMKVESHPFYGLNVNKLTQDDYLSLRKAANELSLSTDALIKLIKVGMKDYHYPYLSNLKELKAFLNVLTFLTTYKGNPSWCDNDHLDDIYDELVLLKQEIARLNEVHDALVNLYTRNIDFISPDLLKKYYSLDDKINKKAKDKIQDLLGAKKNNLEEEIRAISNYQNDLEKAKETSTKFDEDTLKYLRMDQLDQLRDIFNKINGFKNNLKYLKNKGEFDFHEHFVPFNQEKKLHRKSLQSYFNIALRNSEIFQKYFDKEVIDTAICDFTNFNKKVSSISYNFALVNQYTDYYLALHSTNKLISGLGDELVQYNAKDLLNIYLKKFYFEYARQSLYSNEIFEPILKNKISDELFSFDASDEARKNIIKKILDNYISEYLKKNLVNLKEDERAIILSKLNSSTALPRIKDIVEDYPKSLSLIKPCTLAPLKEISFLLKDSKFDAIIYLTNDDIKMKDVLSSIFLSPSIIIFDTDNVVDDANIVLKNKSLDRDSFNKNASGYYENVSCIFESPLEVLNGNQYDHYLKASLAKKLKDHGVDVSVNRLVKGYTIDLSVHLRNSKVEIAIMLDHLPYSSPEQAFKNVSEETTLLKELNFIPYRIVSATYFIDEEKEFASLMEFIVRNSKIMPVMGVKKTQIKLMEYLFSPYTNPNLIYYQMENEVLPLENKIYNLILKCAPISVKEISSIVKENVIASLKKLEEDNRIYIEDGFIYIKGAPVSFRYVKRNEEYYRPLEYVSDKEIYNGIYNVIKHQKLIDHDMVRKMILLSLGYKKTNSSITSYIDNLINVLIDSNVITTDDKDNLKYLEENQNN